MKVYKLNVALEIKGKNIVLNLDWNDSMWYRVFRISSLLAFNSMPSLARLYSKTK